MVGSNDKMSYNNPITNSNANSNSINNNSNTIIVPATTVSTNPNKLSITKITLRSSDRHNTSITSPKIISLSNKHNHTQSTQIT